MKWFTAVARRGVAMTVLLVLVVGAGAWEYLRLPSGIFPDVTFPLVRVLVDAGERPAADMMAAVTRPLEEAVRRVPGARTVRSTTSRGSSELSVAFAWGTDMQVARARVQAETERVRPSLPSGTRIDVVWMNTATVPVLGYAIWSEKESQAALRALADYTLVPALVRVPGVAQVVVQGGRRTELEARLDRAALDGRNLAAADVVKALAADNLAVSAGYTAQNHELYLTLVDGRIGSLATLRQTAVPVPGGEPATLGALGTVASADEVSYVRTYADGHEAVLLSIVRQPGASTLAVAAGAEAVLARPGLVPTDVRVARWYDQARFVRDSVAGTRDAILIGVGLAALVLLVFLRSVRLMLVAALAIPVAVAAVAIFLGAFGQTVNLMTLAGVAAALGLMADDAIVVVENIERQHAAGAPDAASAGVAEIAPALVGSSLSTTLIFIPFVALPGVVGAFFRPLALTMVLALGASFVVALAVVPVAVRRFGFASRPPGRARRRLDALWARSGGRALHFVGRHLGRAWRFLVDRDVRHGWVAALVGVALLVSAWLLYRSMKTDFLPRMDEGAIVLDYRTPPGTSLADTNAMLVEAERAIMTIPDVAGYSRRTGTQLGYAITEPNVGDYVIRLGPRGARRPVDEVIADIRDRLAHLEPAMHTDFGQVLEDSLGDLTGGEPQPVDVKLLGDDPAMLAEKAKQAARLIGSVRGVADVFDGIVIAGPALDVRVDTRAAARYGLTVDDLHAAIEPAVAGTVVGQVRVGDRLYDLRVFARAPAGVGLDGLRVRTPAGALVPVGAVARVATGLPESEIDREDLETYVGVTARLAGVDLGGAMSDVEARLARGLVLSPGMRIEYGGTFAEQERSFADLFYVLVGSLVLVGVVVLFELGDWRAPLVTAVVALGALAGVFALLRLTGMTLNVSSYVGAIMMVGIVGENAIFVMHHARLELRAGASVDEAWRRAAHRRLRPVAMTVAATALALAPLALGIGEGAQLMQPLAVAVIGGFALSGPAVLLLLPGMYRLVDPHGGLGRR